MNIIDKLKEKGYVSTKELSYWQEQQLQEANVVLNVLVKNKNRK